MLKCLRSDTVDIFGPVPQSCELGGGVRENFWGWRQKAMQPAWGTP